jgi:hypothetical protein
MMTGTLFDFGTARYWTKGQWTIEAVGSLFFGELRLGTTVGAGWTAGLRMGVVRAIIPQDSGGRRFFRGVLHPHLLGVGCPNLSYQPYAPGARRPLRAPMLKSLRATARLRTLPNRS